MTDETSNETISSQRVNRFGVHRGLPIAERAHTTARSGDHTTGITINQIKNLRITRLYRAKTLGQPETPP